MVVFIFEISLFVLKVEEFYKILFLFIVLTIVWLKPSNAVLLPIIITFCLRGIKKFSYTFSNCIT